MFIERAPIERDALSEIVESGTLATISRKAHAFKSMALSAGAERLADLLANVESLAANEAEREDIAQMASISVVALEETLAAMRAAAPVSNRMAS